MDEKNVDDSAEKMPPPPSRQEQATIEKAEEQKLRANLAKYPQVNKIILTLSILTFFLSRSSFDVRFEIRILEFSVKNISPK